MKIKGGENTKRFVAGGHGGWVGKRLTWPSSARLSSRKEKVRRDPAPPAAPATPKQAAMAHATRRKREDGAIFLFQRQPPTADEQRGEEKKNIRERSTAKAYAQHGPIPKTRAARSCLMLLSLRGERWPKGAAKRREITGDSEGRRSLFPFFARPPLSPSPGHRAFGQNTPRRRFFLENKCTCSTISCRTLLSLLKSAPRCTACDYSPKHADGKVRRTQQHPSSSKTPSSRIPPQFDSGGVV
jgi:hypothetical protein